MAEQRASRALSTDGRLVTCWKWKGMSSKCQGSRRKEVGSSLEFHHGMNPSIDVLLSEYDSDLEDSRRRTTQC
jgi:hypothetical protein